MPWPPRRGPAVPQRDGQGEKHLGRPLLVPSNPLSEWYPGWFRSSPPNRDPHLNSPRGSQKGHRAKLLQRRKARGTLRPRYKECQPSSCRYHRTSSSQELFQRAYQNFCSLPRRTRELWCSTHHSGSKMPWWLHWHSRCCHEKSCRRVLSCRQWCSSRLPSCTRRDTWGTKLLLFHCRQRPTLRRYGNR